MRPKQINMRPKHFNIQPKNFCLIMWKWISRASACCILYFTSQFWLDSVTVAISLCQEILFQEWRNHKQIHTTIWWWDEQACHVLAGHRSLLPRTLWFIFCITDACQNALSHRHVEVNIDDHRWHQPRMFHCFLQQFHVLKLYVAVVICSSSCMKYKQQWCIFIALIWTVITW